MSALRWGLTLLGVHVVLLFFPPIPPIVNGTSAVGYALGLTAVGFLTAAIVRRTPRLVGSWRCAARTRHRAIVALVPLLVLALSLVFRVAAVERYTRFQREEGLFEMAALVFWLAGAILLWWASAGASAALRRPWRFLAAVYIWFALEDLDYFSIFGGLIGRIEGVYAGSLHDVISLAKAGLMGPRAWGILILAALALLFLLWRFGFLSPRWILARATDPRALWAIAGLAFIACALAQEAHIFGWSLASPPPEEPIELTGAMYLAMYALEEAAGPAFYRPV